MRVKAYYNENDQFAAAWLRELIVSRLIAPGDVDERSITEVKAEEIRGYTQHHFFAGIGVWSYAARRVGWPDDFPMWSGSCPCQSFSNSGKRSGFGDERHVWPAWLRLIRELRPHVIFGEQVASLDGLAWFDVVSADLESEAYTVGALDTCAASVGAPHIRQRLYFVAQSDGRIAEDGNVQRSRQYGLFEDHDTPRDVADAELRRPQQRDEGERGIQIPDAHRGDSMANAESQHHGERKTGKGRRGELADRGGVGDTSRERLQGHAGDDDGNDRRAHAPRSTSAAGAPRSLDDTRGERRQQIHRRASRDEKKNGREPDGDHLVAGPVAHFWSNMRWHYCSDGRYRPVPAEPSLQPLAPRTAGRVGILRGAGNALCAPQAEAFIKAYMTK